MRDEERRGPVSAASDPFDEGRSGRFAKKRRIGIALRMERRSRAKDRSGAEREQAEKQSEALRPQVPPAGRCSRITWRFQARFFGCFP